MPESNPHLFSWETDDMPELQHLILILEHLPYQQIVAKLESRRGLCRNNYPIRALFRSMIAGVVFGHDSVNSLLRELARNVQVAQLCGFNPLPMQSPPKQVLHYDEQGQVQAVTEQVQPLRTSLPVAWNFSRFLKQPSKLEADTGLVSEMIVTLRHQLMAEVPDFGCCLSYDGKALPSHSTGRTIADKDRTSDPDADWGKHKTSGIRKDGTLWEKIKSWFGYRMHLIADTHYEIPVAVKLRKASRSEVVCLRDSMLPQLFEQTPELAEHCQQFTADRGLECSQLKAALYDQYEIRPLIDHKMIWRQEKQNQNYDPNVPIMRLLNDGVRTDNIVYDERGQVYCVCPETQQQREMAFCGFEKDRKILKYRCPAAVYGLDCKGYQECHQQHGGQVSDYGRIARVRLDKDRRIFTPTPRHTVTLQKSYNQRTSLERIFSRFDQGYRFERHYIRGKMKMQTRVNIAMAIMIALAHYRADRKHKMRSLVKTWQLPKAT